MKIGSAWVAGGVVLVSLAAQARATLLVADFNDIGVNGINGKSGGTGFTGTWSGSSLGMVTSGDLTSTLYDVPQGGTPHHLSNNSLSGLRQSYRSTAASPTGTVWFSFLAQADKDGERAGFSLNAPTGTPFSDPGTAYAYLQGSTLKYQFGTGTAASIANAASLGSTVLFVGRVTISPTGADPVSLWINPDLVANPDITAYTPVYSNDSVDWLSAINILGAVVSHKDDDHSSGAGQVDNFRFSDGDGDALQAFRDVTGVPEPTGLLLAAGGAALMTRRRRA
jgi:hypothetical protein